MSPTRIAAESVAELPVVLTTVRDWALAAEATSSAAPARSLCIWELGSWGVGVLVRWKVRPQLANSPTPWGRLLGRLVPPRAGASPVHPGILKPPHSLFTERIQMRRVQSSLVAAAIALLPALAAAQGGAAQAGDASRAVAGGGILVPGWQGRIDASEAT